MPRCFGLLAVRLVELLVWVMDKRLKARSTSAKAELGGAPPGFGELEHVRFTHAMHPRDPERDLGIKSFL